MLHYHNYYMRGTRLDAVVALILLVVFIFWIILFAGPVHSLAKERDQARTNDVRFLMTKLLQLELVDPDAYSRLVEDTRAHGDLRWVIGEGSCSGSHGPQCADAITADDCLQVKEYFPHLLLSVPPVDLRGSLYSQERTGYYLTLLEGEPEIGSCGSAREEITLRK